MANKNAATHSGHCQACGSLQKLPKGVLSLHGYKVTYGFFSGVCRGAGYKAFEESCDQVERYINEAISSLSFLENWQKDLRQIATVNLAWVHNYEGSTYGRNDYTWRQVEVLSIEHTSGDHSWLSFSYMAPGTNGSKDASHRIEFGYGADAPKTILEAVTALNRNRARALDREVKGLKNYIAWQQERVASWKPMPLFPVTHKDKEGFNAE